MISKGTVFILQRCLCICSVLALFCTSIDTLQANNNSVPSSPKAIYHEASKKEASTIFLWWYFCQGSAAVNWWDQNELSNSDKPDKAWAWKLRQKWLECCSCWQALWKSKVWGEKGDWRWRWIFFSCMLLWSRLENSLFSVAPLQSGCGLLEHWCFRRVFLHWVLLTPMAKPISWHYHCLSLPTEHSWNKVEKVHLLA